MIKNIRAATLLLLISIAWIAPVTVNAQGEEDLGPQPAWGDLSASERKAVLAFAEDYKDFMRVAKTEVSFVNEAVKVARD
ncbi:MAG: aminopeptidase 1, partial [Gammaproteobacteria bacterium]